MSQSSNEGFEAAEQYYHEHKEELENNPEYQGRYIGIVGNQVVETGESQKSLDDKLDLNHPNSFVLVVGINTSDFSYMPFLF